MIKKMAFMADEIKNLKQQVKDRDEAIRQLQELVVELNCGFLSKNTPEQPERHEDGTS